MIHINLKTPSFHSSKILIKEGLLSAMSGILKKAYPNSRFVFVTDSNLAKIYCDRFKKWMPSALAWEIPAGEKTKQFPVVLSLCQELVRQEFTRSDVLIGFGGGMVTDVAGFVASIYMRGMPFVAVPTSLLGMVDAAIGGKTGIDFVAKNLLGTFYPADFVLMDPAVLKSFPDVRKMPGMGEVIKYAATLDASLFDDLKKKPLNLTTLIEKSARAKVKVVAGDPREAHRRKVLNFGHTFGHAIETAMDYKISHDHAIGIGMMIANRIAQKLGRQKPETGQKIQALLKSFSMPTELPKGLSVESLIDLIRKDKKRRGKFIDFIIAPRLGKAEVVSLTPEELVELAKG